MSGSRFDPYDEEIRGCFCLLCMTLAGAALHGGTAWVGPSDNLFAALEAGTHTKQGPRVSLTRWDPLRYRSDGSEMRDGLGIGVTLGGVTGPGRRNREETP